MSNEMIAVRLTSEQKERLEQLASQRNQTISDVIRAWIDGNDSGMNGISPDVLNAISIEAKRRFACPQKCICQGVRGPNTMVV